MKITEIVMKFLKAWFEKVFKILLERVDELKEEYPVLKKYLKVPAFVKKIKPMKEKVIAEFIAFIDKLKKKYPVLEKYLVLPETGKERALICRILAAVIVFVSVFGIGGAVTRGERVNVKKTVAAYNDSVPDTSYLYENTTKEEINAQINELDKLLSQAIAKQDVDSLIYCDETASLLTRLIAEVSDNDFDDVKFKALKKSFPDAYDYITSCKDWDDIKTIPFGITKGDKEAFIKACGAAIEFLGNDMISIFMEAPSIYNNALVPALEALQTGEMPSLAAFVLKTGLSGSARVEFIIEKVLTIVEPIKESPVTYLCTMLPDFIVNYERACEFVDDADIDLELPEIEDILDSVFKLLNMTYEPIDLDYLSSLGTAEEAKSGGNKGKRVKIVGDRDSVFLYILEYVLKHIVYEDNSTSVEDLFTHTLKEISPDSFIGQIMYSDEVNKIAGCAANILALHHKRYYNIDHDAYAQQHNAENADMSAAFENFMSEERVSQLIESLDSTLKSLMERVGIESVIYTDTVATTIAKLTATLCHKELSDLAFAALERSFPAAYDYISTLQAEGKTWDDVEVIPFGIDPGDKDMFIKACGAGAEHFGDVLALSFIISPNAYEEALMPVLEAFHTGPMPELSEFIAMQGIDSAKRMELITEKLLTILEPIKESPVTYFCTMLPEFIYCYNIAADCFKNNPDLTKPGMNMPPINEFVAQTAAEFGLNLPEYDLNQIIKYSTASVAPSGDRTGKRIELIGDREAVFAYLAIYVRDIISDDANVEAISNLASELLGINAGIVKPFIALLKTVL